MPLTPEQGARIEAAVRAKVTHPCPLRYHYAWVIEERLALIEATQRPMSQILGPSEVYRRRLGPRGAGAQDEPVVYPSRAQSGPAHAAAAGRLSTASGLEHLALVGWQLFATAEYVKLVWPRHRGRAAAGGRDLVPDGARGGRGGVKGRGNVDGDGDP